MLRRFSFAILALMVLLGGCEPAFAGTVPCYSTQDSASATGVEKAFQVFTTPATLTLFMATNYDATNPKVAMIFDSTTAPATGAVPRYQLALPAAVGANQPAQLSLAIPLDGVKFNNGIYIACSSTGKTFTLDGTANCFFNLCTH